MTSITSVDTSDLTSTGGQVRSNEVTLDKDVTHSDLRSRVTIVTPSKLLLLLLMMLISIISSLEGVSSLHLMTREKRDLINDKTVSN